MTPEQRSEIIDGRKRMSDSKIKEILSRDGIIHIERHIVDQDTHDADPERGAADVYGFHFNDRVKGQFDGFNVIYNGSVYQRESLLRVGWLLEAFDWEEMEREEILEVHCLCNS